MKVEGGGAICDWALLRFMATFDTGGEFSFTSSLKQPAEA
jgi:hypothetical protein